MSYASVKPAFRESRKLYLKFEFLSSREFCSMECIYRDYLVARFTEEVRNSTSKNFFLSAIHLTAWKRKQFILWDISAFLFYLKTLLAY